MTEERLSRIEAIQESNVRAIATLTRATSKQVKQGDSQGFQAYLASKKKRSEVYRRLADS